MLASNQKIRFKKTYKNFKSIFYNEDYALRVINMMSKIDKVISEK